MQCRIAVGIATFGRAAILCETLRKIACQTRQPDVIIVCGTRPEDVAGAEEVIPGIRILMSRAGLTWQRNAAMTAAKDADIIVFFDDDFLPDPSYLSTIQKHMVADVRTVVATGLVLADGIGGPGYTAEQGREILARNTQRRAGIRPVFAGYGCNMAIRLAPVREHGIRFDERLPLYGWQEDVDFSRRLAPFGTVIQIDAACGVHLGVKVGRSSGVRLGYSQVVNPLYLAAKRRGYPTGRALAHIVRNVAMNIARSPRPEPFIDRRGRLLGNALALRDLLTGRMVPERILEF